MISIYKKELSAFFSSLIGYVTIATFLLLLGLVIWVFPDYSILYYNYATLDQLFEIAPLVFLFLIPAVTMRSFAEESQNGTLELLETRPLSMTDIVGGKFLAAFTLVLFALLPTVLYYYSVYQLGSPKGNIDSGAVLGSYIGLIFLAMSFTSIGIFASSVTKNQIVAFLLGSFLCFMLYWGFLFFSKLPSFIGKLDDMVQRFGLDHHYRSISQGILDSRDIIYFFSVILVFLTLTVYALKKAKQ